MTNRTGKDRIGVVVAVMGTIFSMLYLANLTFGVLEIPDNLPLIGNIDEVIASGILFACLSRLGINPIPNFRREESEHPRRLQK